MKKILITGANSYIGMSFENYMKQWPAKYQVDTVDMIDGTWREKSFAGYDVVFHVAGIAHVKETKENAHLYYEVNRDLPIEVAQKAKAEKVQQFLFLSSMSVYGMDTGVITKDTIPYPRSNYGKSKIQAENALLPMQSDNFKVTVMRPPMVYGKGCKGNFQSVVKIAEKMPVFPKVNNKRSAIYIDNLCEYIREYIDTERCGLCFPQNNEYMNTTQMALWIGEEKGKRILASKLLGCAVVMLRLFVNQAQKAFGNLIYEEFEQMSEGYRCVNIESSVRQSV